MRKLLALILLGAVILLAGCPSSGPTLPPTTSGGGFFVSTFTSFDLAPPVVAPLVQLNLTWVNDLPGAIGSASPQTVTTNSAGVGIVANGRVPATWKFDWVFSLTGPCEGQSITADAKEIDDDVGLLCTVENFPGADIHTVSSSEMPTYNFSPNPIATDGSSGSQAVISGPGFNTQFGMPLVQYFDLNGNLVTQASATAVASDGSWMTSPVPDISQISDGTYVGLLSNANSSGGYDILGAVTVQVVPPPPPPPPPDPCQGGRCINLCKAVATHPWSVITGMLLSAFPAKMTFLL